MARVLLGVTGGIAAYKACEVCRLLVKAGHDVVPLVTPGAERFVTAETFQALARRPAAEDVYLHLTRADLLVVAPCTANTLAKLAHGLADRFPGEAHLADGEREVLDPAARLARDLEERIGERRDLLPGERAVDAVDRLGGRDVDAGDVRVRVRAADEVEVAHPVPLYVVDEDALALQEPRGLVLVTGP